MAIAPNEMLTRTFDGIRSASEWVWANTDMFTFEDETVVVAVDSRGSVYRLRVNENREHYWQRMVQRP